MSHTTERQREIVYGFFVNSSKTFYAQNDNDAAECQMFVHNCLMYPGEPSEKGLKFELTEKGMDWFGRTFERWGLLNEKVQ